MIDRRAVYEWRDALAAFERRWDIPRRSCGMGGMLESIPAVARRQVRTEPPAPPHAGMVWVEGHWRDGYWVDGYWRSRPTR